MKRRLRAAWSTVEWPVVWALAAAAVGLGYVGFAAAGLGESRLDRLYLALQLFFLQSGHLVERTVPWTLEVARFLAPLVAAYTASKALLAIFADQLRQARIRTLDDHAVIAGAGRKATALARGFRERGRKVVVVERDREDPALAGLREIGVPVLVGDATDPAVLRRAGIRRAGCLLATCGDDGTNAEIAAAARAAAGGRKRPLACVVHVVDHRLGRLLDERWLPSGTAGPVRLEYFNVFDRGARALLDAHPPFGGDGSRGPHVLVVGLGRFGESLVVRAVRRWRGTEPGGRLAMTVVDRFATRKRNVLCARWPRLPEVCAVRAVDLEVESPAFETGEFLAGTGPVTTAYVCFDDDAHGLSTGLALRRLLPRSAPVVVRMEREAGLATLLEGGGRRGSEFEGLHAFGLIDRTCVPELTLAGRLEAIARGLHDRYVAGRVEAGDTPETNPSLVPWEELPESLRESNRDQALGLETVLGAAGWEIVPQRDWDAEPIRFDEADLERLARAEHERWVVDLERDGWRRGEPPKDPRRKTHPHLVPWADLPEDVREIDRATVRAWPELLAEAGYGVRPAEGRPTSGGAPASPADRA